MGMRGFGKKVTSNDLAPGKANFSSGMRPKPIANLIEFTAPKTIQGEAAGN